MKEQLISFKTAKLAKEKGFDIPCHHGYRMFEEEHKWTGQLRNFDNFEVNGIPHVAVNGLNFPHVTAPTQSLLQKWLREIHYSFVLPVPGIDGMQGDWMCSIMRPGKQPFEDFIESTNNKTYEEALEKGLQEALKLLK